MTMATLIRPQEILVTRRAVLQGVRHLGALWPRTMPRLAFGPAGPAGDVLVCIFLRGGADGLNIIVPHGDATYYALRPTIGIPRPDDAKADAKARALPLDGFFGGHPALGPLLPLFRAGLLTAVHAVGSPDPTRSHFDAMDFMERGVPGDNTLSSGWLGRHLASLDTGNQSPLRGLGWGDSVQDSLHGFANVVAFNSIADYHLQGRDGATDAMAAALTALYAADGSGLRDLAARTQATIDLLAKLNIDQYQPAHGASYDQDDGFAQSMKQTAALIKAQLGLEVAAIDLGGWDTHEKQAPDLASALTSLARGLAAFATDMGDGMGHVTVLAMSEFGRRVQENASAGTDHGHGNVMLVMGGHVAAQPVIAHWPGLKDEQLDDGDLAITTDYRDVLAELVTQRLRNPHLDAVFPQYAPKSVGVVRAN
jgi:uncharacterized protein (DUF1501 family)